MSNIINIECASWYCREDGLVQILSITGNTVILNMVYSQIWEKIDYGITKEELVHETQNTISLEQLDIALNELLRKKLIQISAEEDKFNLLFR